MTNFALQSRDKRSLVAVQSFFVPFAPWLTP